MQGMKIDFIADTITVTKSFFQEASNPCTEEYRALQTAKKENPQMRVVHRSLNRIARRNECKGLTYQYMRRFIMLMDSNNLVNFEKVKLYYESFNLSTGAVYQCMKEWFLENYPYHAEMIVAAVPMIDTPSSIEAA